MMILTLLAAMAAEPELPPCDVNAAKSISIAEAKENGEKYANECVSLQGLLSYNRLYADVEAIYQFDVHDDVQKEAIGIISPYRALEKSDITRSGPVQATLVGRLEICEDEAFYFAGPCHDGPTGPYLAVEIASTRLGMVADRLVGDQNRANFGDLSATDSSHPEAQAALQQVNQLFAAMCVFDRPAIAELLGLPDQSYLENVEWISEDNFQHEFPLVEVASMATREPYIFLAKSDYEDIGGVDVAVCYCRDGTCDGIWPISLFDADADEHRRYACVQYHQFNEGSDEEPDLTEYLSVHSRAFMPEPEESWISRRTPWKKDRPYCDTEAVWTTKSP